MNLNKLFKKQSKLDKYIGETKGLKMEDYKTERVMALLVEFGELINELVFLFKYWTNKKMNRDKVLEEYVDGLHFLLSIGNDHGHVNYKYKNIEGDNPIDMKVLTFGICNIVSRMGLAVYHTETIKESAYYDLVDHYILFGSKLGVTSNEIITHYELKHSENYSRQSTGY